MAGDLRSKIRSEILPTTWEDLAPHFARGGLVLAAGHLDLLEVAMAIATDDKARVEAWLADGGLCGVPDAWAEGWAEASPRFQFVILQPWVLAQVIGESEHVP